MLGCSGTDQLPSLRPRDLSITTPRGRCKQSVERIRIYVYWRQRIANSLNRLRHDDIAGVVPANCYLESYDNTKVLLFNIGLLTS